jgi:hypothetical protein
MQSNKLAVLLRETKKYVRHVPTLLSLIVRGSIQICPRVASASTTGLGKRTSVSTCLTMSVRAILVVAAAAGGGSQRRHTPRRSKLPLRFHPARNRKSSPNLADGTAVPPTIRTHSIDIAFFSGLSSSLCRLPAARFCVRTCSILTTRSPSRLSVQKDDAVCGPTTERALNSQGRTSQEKRLSESL